MSKRCIIRNLLLASASLAIVVWPSISRADTIDGGVISWTGSDPFFVASDQYATFAQYLAAGEATSDPNTPGHDFTAANIGSWVPAVTYTTSQAGTLDITNNQLVIQADNTLDAQAAYQNLLNMVASGYNGGLWTGKGITSSFAAANVSGANLVVNGVPQNPLHTVEKITGIALALNDGNPAHPTTSYIPYDPALTSYNVIYTGPQGNQIETPVSVNADSVLMAFTYYGDDSFQGIVSGADVSNTIAGIDFGYTGTVNGDFNFDPTSTDPADVSNTIASIDFEGDEAYIPQVPTTVGTNAVPAFGPVGVPEPDTSSLALLGVFALGGAAVVGRRRRSLGAGGSLAT